VNPDRALGPAIMSGTFTSLWIYVLATIVGGIAAALLHKYVAASAIAPTVSADEQSDDQSGTSAGDRSLRSGKDT